MASKDSDPFGGLLFRREAVVPQPKEEPAVSYKKKAEELKANAMESVDRDAMELEAARIRTETAKLNLQYQELMARVGGGQGAQIPPTGAPFTGTTKVLADIIQLGQQTGIDVTPLIRQVLTGQQVTLTPPQAPVDPSGVPNWLGGALGKILEKSFDNNSKPHEDAALAVLQEKMKTQELLINKELESIKSLLQMQRGGEIDPNKAAVDNVKNLALLISTVKSLSPEPPAAPLAPNSGDLAFKYQDRQWQHEEKKLEADVKRHEIAMMAQVEQQKMEQSKNNLAQIPEMIGAVVAQTLMENKGNKTAPAPQDVKKEPVTIKLSKSKSLPHGPITIKCEDCHSDVSFITSAKQANCINCGTVYKIQLIETEGGPTTVESVDQPAPAKEKTAAAPSDTYLMTRGQ